MGRQLPCSANLREDRRVDVGLLVVPDCPNADPAMRLLQTALTKVGLGATSVRTIVIDSGLAEYRRGFTGSPTILLNGRDPFAEPGNQPGLACRVYVTPTGPAGTPPLAELRAELGRAAGHGETR